MYLRQILLAGALIALAVTAPLRAEEVQLTFSGLICNNCSLVSQELPFTVSFDLNTSSGQQSGLLFQQIDGIDYLASLNAVNLAITDFSAFVGGHRIDAPHSSTGGFSLNLEGLHDGLGVYDFALGTSGFGIDQGVNGQITETQFKAFKDPVESILGMFVNSSHGTAFTSLPGLDDGITSTETIRIRAVPEPGVLPLLVLGLVGLGLVRRRRAT